MTVWCLLVQYARTAAAVYEAEDSVDTLVELMQIYRDKGADIFTNTCMLLGIMGFYDEHRQVGICQLFVKFVSILNELWHKNAKTAVYL